MTADLDGGTLESELTVTPYTEYQQLPVPVKEGYDFIGWQLPDAQNTKENYFTDINGFNATQLLGAGGGVNGDVYFKTLKAVWSPKQYYKVTEGDVVSPEQDTVPKVIEEKIETIAVVDDQLSIRQLVKSCLKRLGYTVCFSFHSN